MNSSLKLARFLKPYRTWAILAPLMMVLEVAMDLMQPRMIQRIVDEGIAQRDLTVVIQTGLMMIVFALIGAVGGVGCTVFTMIASQGFGTDLRSALFRKVQSLSFGNLDRLETGQIITRLTNDVTQVQEVVSMMLRIMVQAPLMLDAGDAGRARRGIGRARPGSIEQRARCPGQTRHPGNICTTEASSIRKRDL